MWTDQSRWIVWMWEVKVNCSENRFQTEIVLHTSIHTLLHTHDPRATFHMKTFFPSFLFFASENTQANGKWRWVRFVHAAERLFLPLSSILFFRRILILSPVFLLLNFPRRQKLSSGILMYFSKLQGKTLLTEQVYFHFLEDLSSRWSTRG